jgi:mRNA export factor
MSAFNNYQNKNNYQNNTKEQSPENINCVPHDHLIQNIDDTVQSLKFLPSKDSNILASGGWDSKVRIWDVKYQVGQSNNYGNNNYNNINKNNSQPPKVDFNTNIVGGQNFPQPILNLCWKTGNNTPPTLMVSDVAGDIYQYDISSNKVQKLGSHQLGCKDMQLVQTNNMDLLISGGWDGQLKFWDFRSPDPVLSVNMNNKIYAMSAVFPLLVCGLDNNKIAYFNLNKIGQNFQKEAEFDSHLKYQTRSIATFPDASGYCLGSIEGRIAVKNINMNQPPVIDQKTNLMTDPNGKDFAFRCHRAGNQLSEVYPINCLTFNQVHGTFTSGGGDGQFTIWDKSSKEKLKIGHFEDKAPITAMDFSASGDLLAYAAGYDWHKGINHMGNNNVRIGIHYLIDDEKKMKQQGVNNKNTSSSSNYHGGYNNNNYRK